MPKARRIHGGSDAGVPHRSCSLTAELARLSTRGENRLVRGSGNYVQIDKPQAVVDAVTEVVETARRR
jgi:hypothetical protein